MGELKGFDDAQRRDRPERLVADRREGAAEEELAKGGVGEPTEAGDLPPDACGARAKGACEGRVWVTCVRAKRLCVGCACGRGCMYSGLRVLRGWRGGDANGKARAAVS